MFDTFITFMKSTFVGFHLSPQLFFLASLFAIAIYLLFKAAHRDEQAVDWVDLIIEPTTGKLSTTKLGHLVGLIISSWAVVSLTDSDKLTYDIFGLYLAYAGGTAGWSSYLKAKFGNNKDDTGVKQ